MEMLCKLHHGTVTMRWFDYYWRRANVNAVEGLYPSALKCASSSGHEAVVRLASNHSHEAVIKLLLEKGATINSKDNMAVITLQQSGSSTVLEYGA
jgi:hypothetical protein